MADNQVPINDLSKWGMAGGDARRDLFAEVSEKPTDAIEPRDVPALRAEVHRMLASRPGLTFVKTHNALMSVGGYPTITPDVTAAAIYVVRDPRDVALSYASHYAIGVDKAIELMGSDNLFITAGDEIYHFLSSWSGNVSSWLNHPESLRCKIIRYEDMSLEPVKTFRKLLKFLERPHDRARLRRAIKHSSFKTVSSQEAKSGFCETSRKAKRFFRSGKVGAWREELTGKQADRIVADHGEVMERMKYR